MPIKVADSLFGRDLVFSMRKNAYVNAFSTTRGDAGSVPSAATGRGAGGFPGMWVLSIPGTLPALGLECLRPWDSVRAPRAACANHAAGLDFTLLITQGLGSLILIVNAVSVYFWRR